MINELEQKIRKAIPELQELGVGCEIETQTKQRLTIYSIDNRYYNCYNKDVTSTSISMPLSNSYTTIGKQIQLNHVLEYLLIINKYSNFYEILKFWNLKSNLLSEQSEELIKFINKLDA